MFKRVARIAGAASLIVMLTGLVAGNAHAATAATTVSAEIPRRATLTLDGASAEGGFTASSNTGYVSSVETLVEGGHVLTLITVVIE